MPVTAFEQELVVKLRDMEIERNMLRNCLQLALGELERLRSEDQ